MICSVTYLHSPSRGRRRKTSCRGHWASVDRDCPGRCPHHRNPFLSQGRSPYRCEWTPVTSGGGPAAGRRWPAPRGCPRGSRSGFSASAPPRSVETRSEQIQYPAVVGDKYLFTKTPATNQHTCEDCR